jgi:hypothetical protein
MKKTGIFGGYLNVRWYWRVFGLPILIFDKDRGVMKKSQLIIYILRKMAHNLAMTIQTPLFWYNSTPLGLLHATALKKGIKDAGTNGRKDGSFKERKVNNAYLFTQLFVHSSIRLLITVQFNDITARQSDITAQLNGIAVWRYKIDELHKMDSNQLKENIHILNNQKEFIYG